jgi:hypothetical protein
MRITARQSNRILTKFARAWRLSRRSLYVTYRFEEMPPLGKHSTTDPPFDRQGKSMSAQSFSDSRPRLVTQLSAAFDGDDSTWAVAATQKSAPVQPDTDAVERPTDPRRPGTSLRGTFVPTAPRSFRETGLTASQLEALITKFLLNAGSSTGREIAGQLRLPFGLVESLLYSFKQEQLVVLKAGDPFGDYTYELTPAGIERGRRYAQQSTYFGAAPVSLEDYVASVDAQSLHNHSPRFDDIARAFSDLVVSPERLLQLGEAMNRGRALFLYGAAGNGKSSIAESLVNAFAETIWIPRAITVGGEIIRLYDPIHHKIATFDDSDPRYEHLDHRWVCVYRPRIQVGGELELSDLDIATNPVTGINEAPVQLKSNCGVLIFDDFGRNRFHPESLLNRFIVPLEKRQDTLHLASGRTFRVPFHSMVVFSTNLDPLSLVDEAFLRRVPYCIELTDPSDDEFRQVFRLNARRTGVEYSEEDVSYLIDRHYREANRHMRFCHPRDILEHIHNACNFQGKKACVTRDGLDRAVHNLLSLR